MELRLHAVENVASVIELFYKPKQKQFFKFKSDCNPLTGSQNIVITSYFWYTVWPLIFDLITRKSTQFIGSAKHTYLEFDGNPSIGSNDVITSYFCIHNEPHDLWTWPHEPKIYSVRCLSKIHTFPEFHGNLSICSNDNVITSYFWIHDEPYDLMTFYLQNPISSLALQDTHMT